jgi:dTDP-4-amino-4,6-dideoxygalactose transaminase
VYLGHVEGGYRRGATPKWSYRVASARPRVIRLRNARTPTLGSVSIPMFDPTPEFLESRDELLDAAASVLASGRYILGPHVDAFEQECAAYLQVEHAVAVNSGTDGLVIALRALGIGAGDEVVTTSFSFFATAEAISAVGATPRYADIEPDTFNLDPRSAAALIGPKTKAILPVHLFGAPADIDSLRGVAETERIAIIEDCAQAFGACAGTRRVGTIGDAGAYSFFPTKNLGGFGDGGLLVTPHAHVASRARALRAHGATEHHRHEEVGYNSRLDELQAALLRVKLPRVDANNARRVRLAADYERALAGIPGIVTPRRPDDETSHVFSQFTIRVLADRRDDVKTALDAHGIASSVHYPVPLHRLPMYRAIADTPLPHAERAADEVLSLPMWPHMPHDVVERVAATIGAVMRRH